MLCDLNHANYITETEAPSPKRISPSKKRRGRPQRRSRLSTQTDMSPDAESEPSQSFSSLGMNDSIENLEFDSTADDVTSAVEKVVGGFKVALTEAIQKEEPEEDGALETPIREMRAASSEEPKNIAAQVLVDATIDESDFLESSAAAQHDNSMREQMDISSMVEQEPILSVESLRGASAPVQASLVESAPTMRSMREKFQGLISELATAVLTREEVNVFEDMFMDAKEKLYGAARRGRAESS